MIRPPLISVIVATYNRASFLKETIDSILGQTYPHIELIIVSDASTDNTDDTVSSYDDKRIRYIKLLENRGLPSKTRNEGIKMAKGKYIAFCDDDDLWKPEKLKKQLVAINGFDLCFTNRIYIDQKSNLVKKRTINIPPKATLSRLFLSNYITLSSVLVKCEIIKKFGGFDTRSEFQIGEDYELWGRMLAEEIKFCSIDENLVLYRIHNQNISKNLETGIKGTIKINRHLFHKYKISKWVMFQTEFIYLLKLVYYKLKSILCIESKNGIEYLT